MIKRIIASLFVTILFISTAIASDDERAFEESCTQWAKEDGIVQAEMANYIENCLTQLKADDEQYAIAGSNPDQFEPIEGSDPQFDDEFFQDAKGDAVWGKDTPHPKEKNNE
ncbi:MAG: hypothetical protein HQL70_01230 [Magnetococcales bacterium]|nr:hypothetical protein [Magnetococcales bacterium]